MNTIALARWAFRNALRRRAQTLVVVAGLMVGTAIISGSLVSGDSVTYGIRKGTLDAFGPADAFVLIEGNLHFPRYVYDELAAHPAVKREVHALSPLLLEDGAVSNPRTRQNEPRVTVVGFDPALDRDFESFVFADGRETDGSELGAGETYVSRALADRLDARSGDRVKLSHLVPPTPLLPTIHVFDGSIAAGAGACAVPGILCPYPSAPGSVDTFTFDVGPATVRAIVVVAWFGPASENVDLDAIVTSPSGRSFANVNGSTGNPDNPAFLNVTAWEGRLEKGSWTFRVGAKAAANQDFRAFVVTLSEEYDLNKLRNATAELERAGFELPPGFADGGLDGAVLTENLTIRDVVEMEGKGDSFLGSAMFVRLAEAQRIYRQEGRINVVKVSNDGSLEGGLARTAVVEAALREALSDVAAAHPDEPSVKAVGPRNVKSIFLDRAESAGTMLKEFLTVMGSFTIIAGLLLIVNIFVMLAEERRSELGMARAVGLPRRDLISLFVMEGAIYAVVAAFVGVLLGLAIAYVLILGINDLVRATPDTLITIPFHVEGGSLALAFGMGFALTMATVAVASAKVSRLNVVRAIRRIEEPKRRLGRQAFSWALAFLLLSVLVVVGAFVSDNHVLQVLAPPVALVALALALLRRFRAERVFPLVGAAIAAESLASFFFLASPEGLVNRVMVPVRGVLVVLAVVLILVHSRALMKLSKRLLMRLRRLREAVKPAVAYPLERKLRTGLTTGMFALVVLVVVVFSVFGATFTLDLKDQSGGYDVEAETTLAVDDLETWFAANKPGEPDPFKDVERHDDLTYAWRYGGDFITIDGEPVHYQGPIVDYVYAYGPGFAANNAYVLDQRAPEYGSDRAVYEAVLQDPGLVVVSLVYTFDETGEPGHHAVGETLVMNSTSGPASFRIVGIQKQLYLGGLFVHPDVLEANFQRVRGEYLFKVKPGADPVEVARGLEAAFEDLGMDAVAIEEEAQNVVEQSRRVITLFQLFLGFGLVVGIASLGIVTARAVIERRQEIGMLRAIGYPRRAILKIFLLEILFTVTLGIAAGVAIGIAVAYGVTVTTESFTRLGLEFRIPWRGIAEILALTYAATIVATFYPSWRAAKTPPAEAVRYIE